MDIGCQTNGMYIKSRERDKESEREDIGKKIYTYTCNICNIKHSYLFIFVHDIIN